MFATPISIIVPPPVIVDFWKKKSPPIEVPPEHAAPVPPMQTVVPNAATRTNGPASSVSVAVIVVGALPSAGADRYCQLSLTADAVLLNWTSRLVVIEKPGTLIVGVP